VSPDLRLKLDQVPTPFIPARAAGASALRRRLERTMNMAVTASFSPGTGVLTVTGDVLANTHHGRPQCGRRHSHQMAAP